MSRRELAKDRRDRHPPRRTRIAWTLIWLGRTYLVTSIIVLTGCWLSRSIWIAAPRLTGTPSHWIADLTLFYLLVLCVVWPLLFLPIFSFALTTRDGGFVEGVTVLGPRRVEISSARVGRITLPGRSYSSYVASLRDRRIRSLIVIGSGMWHGEHFDEIAGYEFTGPNNRSRSISRYLIGAAVIGASALVGIALMGGLGVLLGLFRV